MAFFVNGDEQIFGVLTVVDFLDLGLPDDAEHFFLLTVGLMEGVTLWWKEQSCCAVLMLLTLSSFPMVMTLEWLGEEPGLLRGR